jgi:D-alanine-D-alanine ligase
MNDSLTIAFLYNIRHIYPDPNDSRSQLETDFDDRATIDGMIQHLKRCGFRVLPIEADQSAYVKLLENRPQIDMALNYSEGIYGNDREAQMPAILEMLQIPYTGSTPLTQALVLNKAKTKEILKANAIPTLPHQVFRQKSDMLDTALHFPLIVKPLSQGSSAGITNQSVVYSETALREQLGRVFAIFDSPVMVESFVSGREFSISMLGNPPKILPYVEPDHGRLDAGVEKIDSLEVKWLYEDQSGFENYLMCPAAVDDTLRQKIDDICLATWKALEIRDFCRIDIRCDAQENPYVLEINSPAGLMPPEISMTSYFPLAARSAGIDYQSLLSAIIDSALKRQKNKR